MKPISTVTAGFTLIELLVSIGVLALLMGGLLASYTNYSQGQQVKQAAQTVKAHLRLAQTKGLSSLKPASGCTELVGYQISFTATTYSIQAKCSAGLVGSSTDVSLPPNISFSLIPAAMTFGVVTRGLVGTNSAETITVTGFGKNYGLVVSPNGDITELGFQ